MATDLDMGLDGGTPGPWLDWETLEWLHEPKHLLARTEDARLIAAAPELLSQLQYAVKLLGAFPALSGTAQVQSMRETIAKAAGELSLP